MGMSKTFPPGGIAAAGQRLRDAASNALGLLELTGHPLCSGNTTDDLRIAIANYEQAIKPFAASKKLNDQMLDRAALERAHRALRTSMPLDEMLKQPALAKTIAIVASQEPRKRRPSFDWRKAQANDLD